MSDDIDELLSKLEDLVGDTTDALVNGLRRAGKKIQSDAKNLCPVDTGQLRNSIIEYVQLEGDDIVECISTNSDHAAYVEFGTGPVGERSPKLEPPGINLNYKKEGWYAGRGYTEGQPAKPFLYPAYKQNEQSVPDIIAKTIRAELKKLAE